MYAIRSYYESETEVTTENDSSEVEQTTAPQNTIIMPDLVNLNYDIQNNAQALKEWIEMIPTYSFNEQYPAGTIFEQDVPKDKEITAGTVVNVKVSKGSQFATVPGFEGLRKEP